MKILATVLMASALMAGFASHAADNGKAGATTDMKQAADMPTRAADGRLVGPNGNTLYVYAKDSSGMSNCNDQCATNWPPLTAAANAKARGDYTVVTRSDGTHQWAYKGQPLYYFVKDTKTGDMTGEGMAGNWKTVRPQ